MLYPSEESLYCFLPYDKMGMFDEYKQVLSMNILNQDERGMTLEINGPSDYVHAFDLYRVEGK